jgi:predicted 3-demethylubiquinone-9 3-methyltransferase (glyoxalase superfamily)
MIGGTRHGQISHADAHVSGNRRGGDELLRGGLQGSRDTESGALQPGEPGTEGSVKVGEFEIAGQTFLCIDSPVRHDFTFTPAISIHVECESEEELKDVFYRLGSGGAVFMPLDNYGFSRMYGWLSDRFGVSWQLNLK